MKKKLLPFILGCAMVATMPLAAHAEVSHHVGEDIVGGSSAPQGDKATADYNTYKGTADGHNEFTEHNDGSSTNTLAKVFGTSATATNRDVTWTAGVLGNTRNTTAQTQTDYPIAIKNEAKTETTLAADIADATFGETTNDCFGDGTDPLVNGGYTDLETSIPEFDMTIPATTVVPIGATSWQIGQVEMNGRYFVNPDKIGLILTKQNFHHSTFDGSATEASQTAKVIPFDIQDAGTGGTSIVTTLNGAGETTRDVNTKIVTFSQDGTQSTTFPYAYTYTTERNQPYADGMIAEINEAKDLWLKTTENNPWKDKTRGKYTGSVTFTAYIINGNLVENDDPLTAPFPKKVDGTTWWEDQTT